MNNPICYGDVVFIELDDNILFSNGFFDPTLYFVSKANMPLKAFSFGLFKIYPNLSYKDVGQVDNQKEQLDLLKSMNPKEKLAYDELSKDIELEKKSLDLRDEKLDVLNNKILNESHGKPVRYGQKIQLFHTESQTFLCPSKKLNVDDKSMTSMVLTPTGTKKLYFTFMPIFSFVQEGGIVEYNNPLKLVCNSLDMPVFLGSQINVTTQMTDLCPESNTLINNTEDFPSIPPRRKEPSFQQEKIYAAGFKDAETKGNTYVRKFVVFSSQDDALGKRVFMNGDYIRISNDRVYLTVNQGRNSNAIYFQSFIEQQDYNFNSLNTLFQILEVPQDTKEAKDPHHKGNTTHNYDSSYLLKCTKLEYTENKRFILKHVASGKLLICKDRELQLQEREDAQTSLETISVFVKNKPKDTSKEKNIEKNTVMQIKFHGANGQCEGVLSIDGEISLPKGNLDTNTMWFFGFDFTENYLNKILLTERHTATITATPEDKNSSLKFVRVAEQDSSHIFLGESFANQFLKFLNFLNGFLGDQNQSLAEFNKATKKLLEACTSFEKQIYEKSENESQGSTHVPIYRVQTVLRELRVHDMMYETLFYLVRHPELKTKIQDIKAGKVVNDVDSKTSKRGKVSSTVLDDVANHDDVNYEALLKLVQTIKSIIFASFKKNELNRYYCSQFVRIPINCIIGTDYGLFSLSPFKERLEMRETMLTLCKKGLWDNDLDALGQLNFYENFVFESLETQESFHTIYLHLMEHIARSEAPNLNNQIRDNLVSGFLQKSGNIEHLFPTLTQEGEKIYVLFNRKAHPDSNQKVALEELDERLLEDTGKLSPEKQKIQILTKYLISSLSLLAAIALPDVPAWMLTIVTYYQYNIIIKAIESLKTTPHNRQIRLGLGKIVNYVHQRFFNLPIVSLPKKLQVLNRDTRMDKTLKDTELFLKNTLTTTLSESEQKYINDKDILVYIDPLKSALTSNEDLSEVLKLLRSSIPASKLEEASNLVDVVEEILETNEDINLEFLKDAHQNILRLLREATHMRNKAYNSFITKALEVFTMLEVSLISYAATDIISVFQSKNFFEERMEQSNDFSPIKKYDDNSRYLLSPNASNRVTPEFKKDKERTSNVLEKCSIMAGAVTKFSNEWKTGQRLYSNYDANSSKVVEIEDAYKEYSTSEITSIFLEITLLHEDVLLSEVIQQLRRRTSFESLLYTELSKLTIIHDPLSLKKAEESIRLAFRLNEIARKISFCSDKSILIEKPQMTAIIAETLDIVWKMFFMIYDASKHFKHNDLNMDAEDRFKENFIKYKSGERDQCFIIVEDAVSRPFQKIFNILKVYKSLFKTLNWVRKKKLEFSDEFKNHTIIIRVIVSLIGTFVNKNRENQDHCSKLREFITLYYVQDFINQSADALSIFGEMMRGNKKLLKLPLKYLYDITVSTFVGTYPRKVSNDESNSYLATSLINFDYVSKCPLPLQVFNPTAIIKSKWTDMLDVDSFTSLNLLNTPHNETTSPPFCYQTIKTVIEITIRVLDTSLENYQASGIQNLVTFQQWLSFFESENYLLQYQLKNLITQCISKTQAKAGKKGTFIQNSEECVAVVCYLMSDILQYRKRICKKKNQDSLNLEQLSEIKNFINTHENYKRSQELYAKASEIDFEKKKIQLNLEDFSLLDMFSDYIYEGCIGLLFDILLQEVDDCKLAIGKGPEIRTIMDFALILFEDMITLEGQESYFPMEKFEKFLNEASVTTGYSFYKERIRNLMGKLYGIDTIKGKSFARLGTSKNAIESSGLNTSPSENYQHLLLVLSKDKAKLKENNVRELANCIAEHPNCQKVIQGIVEYLKRDLTKISAQEIKFLLKLLRKYIERENFNNPNDDPIYQWKEVNITDLKKISKIQQQYRSLGLTDRLYTLLNLEDKKVCKEALLLCLAYMYGGNREIQQEFLDRFINDDENSVISDLGARLTIIWSTFREKEGTRMSQLYAAAQKNLFNHLKGNNKLQDTHELELQLLAYKKGIKPKYLRYAEDDQDNRLFMLTLEFFQSLCEGQFTDMQNFLRVQQWNGKEYPNSFDLVGFLRHTVNSYHKVLNKYNLSVGIEVLDLINELIQGEVHENINDFLNKSFIYDMCRIVTDYNSRYHTLPRGFGLDPFQEDFRQIKSQVIFIFKTMLENKNEENISTLTQHLDFEGLMATFNDLIHSFIKKRNLRKRIRNPTQFANSLTNEDFKDALGDAVNIYIIFRYVWSDTETFANNMKELISQMDKESQDLLGVMIFNVFLKLANSIEIIVAEKSEPLMRIWYPVIASCNYLNEDMKENFLINVDRSNSQTKIADLMDASQEFVPQIQTEYNARGDAFGLNNKKIYYVLRFLTNWTSLVITILNVATYEYDSGDAVQDKTYTHAATGLNILQIVLATLILILWLLLFRTRNKSLMWERYVDENIKATGFLPPTVKNKIDDGNFNELTENDCRLIMMLNGANSDEFKEMRQYAESFKSISQTFYVLDYYFTIKSGLLLWHFIYLLITIFSLLHPLVAVFQIFDVALRSDAIKQIYTALSRNVNQFLWTLFLLVLVNVVYSTIGFFFLNSKFVASDDALCQTAFSCFLNTLNLGLRSGGGIADAIGSQPYQVGEGGLFLGRVIFDMSFFIIMIILLLNLIFGMIIDAFGDLRDQKTSNEEDHKNVCFICGIDRSEFERHTSFENHIANDHNLWAYVYYIVYLLDRQKTAKVEMTDIENFVLEKYLAKDIDWIPVGKSLTLESIYAQERRDKEDEMENLSKKVEAVQKHISAVEAKLTIKIEQILSFVKK